MRKMSRLGGRAASAGATAGRATWDGLRRGGQGVAAWNARTRPLPRAARAMGRGLGHLRPRSLRSGLMAVLVAVVAAAIIIPVMLVIGVWARLPDIDTVIADAERVLVLQDESGEPLVTGNAVPSIYATLDEIPQVLIDAVLAIEDTRFYDHGGLDLRSIGRAAFANMSEGGVAQGGSTLTQQLAKVLYLEPDRTFSRKLQEALIARRLEDRLGKDEILEQYLNVVYMGSGARGLPAAAQVYFDRDVADLSLAQAALLAGAIKAPSALNPAADLDAAKERARVVLARMEAVGFIDLQEAEAARTELVTLMSVRGSGSGGGYGSWFADWVAPSAVDIADDFKGIVTLRTTLDPELQRQAEAIIEAHVTDPEMQVALVALRGDGSVAAMVGGRDYAESQFNRATDALRSPGSTFKTFTFLAALGAGFGPADTISDSPLEIDGYSPQNFDGEFRGNITLQEAFTASRNAATVDLAMQIGLENVLAAARALGIEAELSPTPAMVLGADGVPLIEMVEAYAALAANRAPFKAHGVEGFVSNDTDVLHRFQWPEPEADGLAAHLLARRGEMIGMLQGVIENGTGQQAQLGRPAAGKTGTGQDNRDALFIGFDHNLALGVWVGYDDNRPMDGVTGGTLPALIWRDVLQAAAGETVAAETALQQSQAEGGEIFTAISRIQPAGPVCNIEACDRAYRSFRASDCTFQPYSGPRKLCEK